MKLAGRKSALTPAPPPPTPPVVYSTDRSKAVVPVLVLLFVALWFILRADLFCLIFCHFVLVFFSPFSIAITSLGEAKANLSAFRTFVRFVLVWICRFPGVSLTLSCFVVYCGLVYEAICCMYFRVSFCSCVFQSFKYCDNLAWGRES